MTPAKRLERLRRHRVVTGPLPARPSLTLAQYAALEQEARFALYQPSIEAIRSLPDVDDVRQILASFGRERFAPAVPMVAELWRSCPVSPIRVSAGHALFEIGTPEAHAAIMSMADDHDHFNGHLAAKSTLHVDASRAFDQVSSRLAAAKAGDSGAMRLVSEVLGLMFAGSYTFVGDQRQRLYTYEPGPRILRSDPRWIDLAVALRHDEILGSTARAVLGELSGEERAAALARAPAQPPVPPPRTEIGSFRDALSRWRSGDHAVWDEIASLGPIEGDLRLEAAAVADAIMARVAANAARIAERLRRIGWPVHSTVPGSADSLAARVAELERICEGRVPIAITAFWRQVGAIDWAPERHSSLEGLPSWVDTELALEEIDPLVICTLEDAWYSVEGWLERVDEEEDIEVAGPLELGLAPDALMKMGISGGGPYHLRLPDGGADPIFRTTPRNYGWSHTSDMRSRGAASRAPRAPRTAAPRSRSTTPS